MTTRQISTTTTTTTTTATSPPSSSPSVYTPGIVALMEIVTCRGCSFRPGEINLVLQGDGGPNITCAPSPPGGSLSSLACFQLGKALLPPAAGLNHINGLNGFGPGVLSPAGWFLSVSIMAPESFLALVSFWCRKRVSLVFEAKQQDKYVLYVLKSISFTFFKENII